MLQFGHSVAAVDDAGEALGFEGSRVGTSIRPQRRRRGWGRPAVVFPKVSIKLQFGHSVAAVDDPPRKGRCTKRIKELQFGHSVAAVDDVDPPAAQLSAASFNSATASPPWMTCWKNTYEAGREGGLQFGHSVAAVDDLLGRIT